jgi:hypothetical protein
MPAMLPIQGLRQRLGKVLKIKTTIRKVLKRV